MQLIDPEQRDISKLADKLTDDWESRFNAPKKIRDDGTPNPNYVHPNVELLKKPASEFPTGDLIVEDDEAYKARQHQRIMESLDAEEKARNA